MANKQINELTEKSAILGDSDYLLAWDAGEASSEKTKKVAVSNYISYIPSTYTLHVTTSGSDTTGDGSAENSWATPNKALEWLSSRYIDPTDGWVRIDIADGTYNDLDEIVFRLPTNRVIFSGNTGNPAAVTLNFATGKNGFYVHGAQSYLYVEGVKAVGYDKSEWKTGFYTQRGGCLQVNYCTGDDWGNGSMSQFGSHMWVVNSTMNNCQNGASGYQQGDIFVQASTLSNNANGLTASEMGRAMYTSVTFTNNSSQDVWTATGGLSQAV